MHPHLLAILIKSLIIFSLISLILVFSIGMFSRSTRISFKFYITLFLIGLIPPVIILNWMESKHIATIQYQKDFISQWRNHQGQIHYNQDTQQLTLSYQEPKTFENKTFFIQKKLHFPLKNYHTIQEWLDTLPKETDIKKSYIISLICSLIVSLLLATSAYRVIQEEQIS